jgi:O-antigen/teichoic acid export membrane protein
VPTKNHGRGTSLIRSQIGTLLLSSVTSQLVPVMAMPVLSRLFSPHEFGVLGVYLATIAVLSVAGCLRLEHGVLIEPDENDAGALARLCMRLCAGMGVLTLVVLVALHGAGLQPQAIGLSTVAYYAIAPGMAVSACVQLQSVRLLRASNTTQLARGRIIQALATSGLGIAAGLMSGSADVLVLATLTGQCVGVWVLRSPTTPSAGYRSSGELWERNRRFPLFTLPSDLLSAGSAQLPMFFLAATYGPVATGIFLLAQRALLMPLSMVGAAVTDVFKSHAAKRHDSPTGSRSLTLQTMGGLAVVSVIPCLVVIFWAPPLFVAVFGAEWRDAGTVCQLLAVAAFVRLVATPISYNFYLAGRQREDLLAQGYGLLSNAGIFVCAQLGGWSLRTCVLVYGINLTVIYLYYMIRSVALSTHARTSPDLGHGGATRT